MVIIVTINAQTYDLGVPSCTTSTSCRRVAGRTATFLAQQARDTGASAWIALELGIGTGRVAIPLAELGVTVFGQAPPTRSCTSGRTTVASRPMLSLTCAGPVDFTRTGLGVLGRGYGVQAAERDRAHEVADQRDRWDA